MSATPYLTRHRRPPCARGLLVVGFHAFPRDVWRVRRRRRLLRHLRLSDHRRSCGHARARLRVDFYARGFAGSFPPCCGAGDDIGSAHHAAARVRTGSASTSASAGSSPTSFWVGSGYFDTAANRSRCSTCGRWASRSSSISSGRRCCGGSCGAAPGRKRWSPTAALAGSPSPPAPSSPRGRSPTPSSTYPGSLSGSCSPARCWSASRCRHAGQAPHRASGWR